MDVEVAVVVDVVVGCRSKQNKLNNRICIICVLGEDMFYSFTSVSLTMKMARKKWLLLSEPKWTWLNQVKSYQI